MNLVDLMNMVTPPEEPTYENGRLVSWEDYYHAIEEVEEDFGSLDFHTNHSGLMSDPFVIVAEIERKLGAPLACCSTTVIGN